MRDPSRVPLVLAAVGRAWTECPDMRLGQLLQNACAEDGELFHVEDGDLVRRVAAYADVELSVEQQTFVRKEPEERREAMAAFIYEADGRFGFPD